MMFCFKRIDQDVVSFHELGHIRERDETLVLGLKHFQGDLRGWEEKDEVRRYPSVEVDGDRLYFEGFAFERVHRDEINVHASFVRDKGTVAEVAFNYKRAKG